MARAPVLVYLPPFAAPHLMAMDVDSDLDLCTSYARLQHLLSERITKTLTLNRITFDSTDPNRIEFYAARHFLC